MYKSKSIKKTIVVAAAAGMLITTSLGTVSASQLLNDSTVGISSAFDKYASSLVDGADKDTDSLQKNVATASDAAKPVSGSSTKDDIVAAGKKTDGDKSETKKIKKIKYPQFEDRCIAVTDDYVNIRSEAGIDSDVVGIIGNAGVADVVEKGKEWTKVSSGNCVGYIRNDLLLYGDDAGEYAEANCSKMATVNTETLNVREQADTSADCITQVGAGQSFDILSQTDKWVQIALDDQTSGYVSADYIEYTYKLDEAKTLEELQAEIQAQEDAQKQAEEDEADAGETQDATDALRILRMIRAQMMPMIHMTIKTQMMIHMMEIRVLMASMIMIRIQTTARMLQMVRVRQMAMTAVTQRQHLAARPV